MVRHHPGQRDNATARTIFVVDTKIAHRHNGSARRELPDLAASAESIADAVPSDVSEERRSGRVEFVVREIEGDGSAGHVSSGHESPVS